MIRLDEPMVIDMSAEAKPMEGARRLCDGPADGVWRGFPSEADTGPLLAGESLCLYHDAAYAVKLPPMKFKKGWKR